MAINFGITLQKPELVNLLCMSAAVPPVMVSTPSIINAIVIAVWSVPNNRKKPVIQNETIALTGVT